MKTLASSALIALYWPLMVKAVFLWKRFKIRNCLINGILIVIALFIGVLVGSVIRVIILIRQNNVLIVQRILLGAFSVIMMID